MRSRIQQLAIAGLIMACNCFLSKSQNLVPNPSFEFIKNCPLGIGVYPLPIVPWNRATLGSPDCFNACNTTDAGVPQNNFGFQNARTGIGYAGFACYHTTMPVREYLRTTLLEKMKINKKYCVSFYVSLADSSEYACDMMGCYLSATPDTNYNDPYGAFVPPLIPQINNTQGLILNDSAWHLISGIYTSNGNENYICIGNFYSNANTASQIRPQYGATSKSVAYYYLDDVAIYQVIEAFAGDDKIICKNKDQEVVIGDSALTGATYSWQPSLGLSDDTVSMPVAKPSVTTTYTLSINYSGPNCTGKMSDTLTVFVNECENSVFIPNAFSPNADGKNDRLLLHGRNVRSMQFLIFNRWGEKIYESSDINAGWDGYYNGKICESGVYYYRLTGFYIDDTPLEQKGNITLMR